jgi:Domain of unknown function (DUF4124)
MKMLISMLFTLGIILFASQYMLKNMGGIPGFNNDSSGGPTEGLKDLGNAVLDKDVTVYQWTDSAGVTHYGGTPPTGQGQYEKKMIHSNTNVMQAHKIAEEEEEPEQRARVARVGSLYSPEGVKDLMGDAKGLQDQLNQRTADQEKLLNDIMNPSGKE